MNLVIVESPAKARTIAKFLGRDFVVESSIGHIRDIVKKDMGIDVSNNFKPSYVISSDKVKIVAKLKKLTKQAQTIYLATDEDREGESIAWHLVQALKLPENTSRIVFHEITKPAITRAIEKPRIINKPLVDAQQARRVIDRLVGFEISPVLWRKISGAKSAGRVQSAVVRLVVEKEQEINAFKISSSYKVSAELVTDSKVVLAVKLSEDFTTKTEAKTFANHLLSADLVVKSIQKIPTKRKPPPPFMTSSLQQEAAQKLGLSVKQTMIIAQNLYRDGHISYMRTDSLNLSELAIKQASEFINKKYGKDYLQITRYKSKSTTSQEAHEAIRPTDLTKVKISGLEDKDNTQKLYQLIHRRTLASQMSEAQLEKTQINVAISGRSEQFIATGEVLKFDGFLAVHAKDNKDKLLPPFSLGDKLNLATLEAKQAFTRPPSRYSEASLVKKIETMGIGRPSTFATMISTVQERGYVIKDNIDGKLRTCEAINIVKNKITESRQKMLIGADKNKLSPSATAYLVTDFLVKYFDDIIDYQFTANLETDFDKIANQDKIWYEVVAKFYQSFHPKIANSTDIKREQINYNRNLGTHPDNSKQVSVRIGKYGAFVQIGNKDDSEAPKFASLKKDQNADTITLDAALELLKLPREVGKTADGTIITANYGRFGPYIQYGKKYVSIKPEIPEKITLEKALLLITEKEKLATNRVIKIFKNSDIQILNGKFGPYITNGKKRGRGQKNITVKKLFPNQNPKDLTLQQCEKALG